MHDSTENRLEALLTLSADEPAHRPEFFRVLLESEVYIISDLERESEGRWYLTADDALSILTISVADKDPIIPFFSSIDELTRFVDFPAQWIGINARDLFTLTKGATLVLNPQSRFSKPFYPTMIEALLTTGIHHTSRRTMSHSQAGMRISPPEPYPSKMVDSLIIFFATRPEVTSACVALKQSPEDRRPHLIVGIDGQGNVAQIIREAGSVALDTVPEELPEVAVVDMNAIPAEISKAILRNGRIFYEKSWGARLMDQAGRA
jgi:SseB protein N-terminal domain/SseB protein C-terminal domain